VEPNLVDRYAEAISELLDDRSRRRLMGKYGRDRVENVLAWRNSAEHYIGVYERLLGRSV